MRNRRDPWKWPVTIGLAVGLMVAGALWLPRSWLGFLLVPRDPTTRDSAAPRRWMTLVPPPEIQTVAPDEVTPPDTDPPQILELREDPRWWQDGWAVTATEDTSLFAPTTPAFEDTLRLLLGELGLDADFMTEVKADSLLAERLFLLQVEDSFRFDELKPYLTGLARSRTYADINARAADMYDEHLSQEIQVPD